MWDHTCGLTNNLAETGLYASGDGNGEIICQYARSTSSEKGKALFLGLLCLFEPFLFFSSRFFFCPGFIVDSIRPIPFDLLKCFGFGVELDIATGEANHRNTFGIFQANECSICVYALTCTFGTRGKCSYLIIHCYLLLFSLRLHSWQ